MKVLTSWLREFTNPSASDEELAENLTMAGLEVDGIDTIAPYFEKVVVGEVVSCEKHPDADKLNLCKVDVGSEVLQIICGAKNVRKGLKVCVATNGAVLPGNFKIKKAKLRGVESNGMLCSESEIGLAEKSDGIMELDNSSIIGTNIREVLHLDDKIIELDITPNRGDCFSMLGVAREVCASYGTTIDYSKHFDFNKVINTDIPPTIQTSVQNVTHCPKYLIREISGIDNSGQTPKWMADLLTRSGQNLHSPVVDITNFVLLELGQPMHAFDKTQIQDGICVRLAHEGERLELLNEQSVELQTDSLIIADDTNPLAIAGVMGGLLSSTTAQTTEIILESAFFNNVLIAGVARNYGLHTESSLRFERGVDYNLPEIAIERATQLILEICGGKVSDIVSSISEDDLPKTPEITITYAKISKILGFEMDPHWILEKFQRLNFEIVNNNETQITITPPSYRFDINIEADLIEELARLYGYDKLPTAKLSLESNLTIDNTVNKYDLKNILVANNYNEVISYSFIDEKMANIIGGEKITLLNPISKDMSIMRSSVIAGLLKTAVDNSHRGQRNLKIFETGLCFNGVESNQQVEKIAGLITGSAYNNFREEHREVDFFDLKADVLSIAGNNTIEFAACQYNLLQTGQAANIIINGEKCGIIGAISPTIKNELGLNKCFVFELNLDKILHKNTIKYHNFSIYQSSSRDISMLFDEGISYNDIYNSIESLKQKNLIEIKLLDIWKGDDIDEDKQSITISLVYQSFEKTLTDEEIDNPVKKIIKLLTTQYNAEQR